jgi:tRNA (mo5U34)-methyltransferase
VSGVVVTDGLMRRRLRARARRRRLRDAVESVPFWYHSIELGGGLVTPGEKSSEYLAHALERLHLPDLSGKRVLDVGTWDGFYAFEAERRGAREVVAVDSVMWNLDMRLMAPPHKQHLYDEPRPGRRGFEIAHEALGSSVEPVLLEVDELDPARLGTFDVVLFLGVVYHLRDPLGGLERAAALTDELLVVESHLNWYPGAEERAVCEFYETTELCGDPTNWWGPNAAALLALIRAAGCERAELVATHEGPDPTVNAVQHYRGVAHGHRRG